MTRPTPRAAAILSAAVAFALFLPTLRHGFAYDDGITLLENPLVREHRFAQILLAPYHTGPSQTIPTGAYRPLTIASFAAQHAMHGLSPAGYHAGNILLHALVSALAAWVAAAAVRTLGRREAEAGPAALLAGLLFAVHPVHVEAVANVSGRAELLAAACGLGALLAFARARATGWVAGSVLLFLACLAKESAVTLVAPILVWDLLRTRRWRTVWIASIPVAASLVLRWAVLGSLLTRKDAVTFLENPVVGQGAAVHLMTALAVAGKAAGLLFLPWKLTPDYGFAHTEPATVPWDPAVLAGVVALGGAVYAIAKLWRRRPDAVFGVVLILAPWFLVSNLVITIGTVFGERLLYLPSAGFALVVGAGLASILAGTSRRTAWIVALTAVACLAVLRSATYARAWKDDFALFTAAERTAPRSVRVLSNLGMELAVRGRLEEAERRLVRARDLAPWVVPVRINLAGVYLNLGRLEEAEREAREAVRLAPDDPIALAQLRAVLARE